MSIEAIKKRWEDEVIWYAENYPVSRPTKFYDDVRKLIAVAEAAKIARSTTEPILTNYVMLDVALEKLERE